MDEGTKRHGEMGILERTCYVRTENPPYMAIPQGRAQKTFHTPK